MRNLIVVLFLLLLSGCMPPNYSAGSYATSDYSPKLSSTVYSAQYSFSLSNVERPEKASQRYGQQKIDTLSQKQYHFYFEDDLVRVLWSVSSNNISFYLQNKTEHSIKIPWDEAAFIDENGSSHRVMHSGVKYNDREQPQAPSIIARKSSIEDLAFPTDYVEWKEGSEYTSGKWDEKSFFPDFDYHSKYSSGTYPSFESFDQIAKSNVGKTLQVLLPLQIEDVVNDYIFSFKVDSVSTSQETKTF